jgi:ataxia telangiectasia mutated family protein
MPSICNPYLLLLLLLLCLQGVPHVTEVDSVVDLPGGINVPMVVRTTDSIGNSQKQLVKSGNDDLRQDAVMQQFFGLINDLLSSSPESQQRQLSLRTYRCECLTC